MKYIVKKVHDKLKLDGNWQGNQWNQASPLDISLYMGDKPDHYPKTQAKLLYDDYCIYVMFRVEDQYVRALASHQGPVCLDSCVEFFFTPGTDTSKGYFNIEMNCAGTMLFHHQVLPRKDARIISEQDCKQMQVWTQLPRIVDPEISAPLTWIVAYSLPISILHNYAQVTNPAPGVVWRANFYKCGDNTSHPHWLTWVKVNRPVPDFHVPESFGELVFE
jgi:hypothetical protein